jgi:colanic acid/amylovoran biosynthesis glycosyltransferase
MQSLSAALEQLSKSLDVNAEFLGGLGDADMRMWLSRARIFAGPSITTPDGDAGALGMVFAEAQATGLPVVSSYHGGIPEVVRDEQTGLLAPERDSKALARHISRFLTDDEFWRACCDRAQDWVAESFDLVVKQRYWRTYTPAS